MTSIFRKSIYTLLGTLSALTLDLGGCGRSPDLSEVSGASVEELDQARQAYAPRYNLLGSSTRIPAGSKSLQIKKVKLALFFTTDNANINPANLLPNNPDAPDFTSRLQAISTDRRVDQGIRSATQLLLYLTDPQDLSHEDDLATGPCQATDQTLSKKTLLKRLSHLQLTSAQDTWKLTVEGYGAGIPGIANLPGKKQAFAEDSNRACTHYVFNIYMGPTSASSATAFGRAMAEHDISIMSGHFYARNAQAALQNGNITNRWLRYFRARYASYYTGMLDQFQAGLAAQAPKDRNKYRIVFFNGCGSELIEDLILQRLEQLNQGQPGFYNTDHLDILGIRSKNEFQNFPLQTASLLKGLIAGMDWKNTLNQMRVMNNLEPVVRNNQIKGDGIGR